MSPTSKDFVLTRIGTGFVSLASQPIVPAILQGLAATTFLLAFTDTSVHAYGERHVLKNLSYVMAGLFMNSLTLYGVGPASSLRRVTSDEGELQLLGAGMVSISAKAARHLRLSNAWKSAFAVMFVLVGFIVYSLYFKIGSRSAMSGNMITFRYFIAIFFCEPIVWFILAYTYSSVAS